MHVEECWCCSVAKSCPTLCVPMNGSMSGFPVLHYLSEFAQMNVHWIGNAYPQPSSSLPAPQSFPASGFFFSVSWLFASGSQSIGVSASASILSMNIQDWFLLGLTSLISLQTKRLSRVLSKTTIRRHQFFSTQSFLWSNSHICTWLLEKTIALTIWTYVNKVMSLLFNTLSRSVIVFLPRSKHLLI